jgi:two-component system, NarL family, nitrate/nitrite response regulator NarL
MAAAPTASIAPGLLGRQLPGARHQKRIFILIADDSRMGCYLLKSAITRSRFGFEVVACATTRDEIIQNLKARPVDIALLNEDLLDGSLAGFQVVSELRVSFPKTRVVLLLKSVPDDLIVDAFRSGAKGVFCRTEPVSALCKCIRSVHQGQIWANSKQLDLILEALIRATPLRTAHFRHHSLLTKREHEVFNLVAEGLPNKVIAQRLGITEHTVSNYLFRMYDKLGISSRVELVLYALERRQTQTPRA